MSEPSAWYYEGKIAEKLGVSRADLKYVRAQALQKKKDWRLDGRDVVISDSGLKKILKFWESAPVNASVDFSECAVAKKKTAAIIELVVKRPFLNRRLLLATIPETGAEVRVKVSDNVNFRPLMQLKARPPGPPPAPQIYRLEGRCPRSPGRW